MEFGVRTKNVYTGIFEQQHNPCSHVPFPPVAMALAQLSSCTWQSHLMTHESDDAKGTNAVFRKCTENVGIF